MSEWTGWDTHPNSLWGVWYQSDGLRVRWVTLQAMAGVMGCCAGWGWLGQLRDGSNGLGSDSGKRRELVRRLGHTRTEGMGPKTDKTGQTDQIYSQTLRLEVGSVSCAPSWPQRPHTDLRNRGGGQKRTWYSNYRGKH